VGESKGFEVYDRHSGNLLFASIALSLNILIPGST
jgi:hypothetical protein